MKKLIFLVFICACVTACGNTHDMQQTNQLKNKIQKKQENKEMVFDIQDRVYKTQNQNGEWNIHYPSLNGEATELCNKVILTNIKKIMNEIDLEQETDITLNYDIKTKTDKIFSVLFTGNYNVKETAHPVNISFSVNYDWEQNREFQLKDIVTEPEGFVEKCKKAVLKQCGKEFQTAFNKLPEERIREQILEEENQFYLEDEKIYVRLAIPVGAYYYQYVSCDMED